MYLFESTSGSGGVERGFCKIPTSRESCKENYEEHEHLSSKSLCISELALTKWTPTGLSNHK
jgi:hypothetical protein